MVAHHSIEVIAQQGPVVVDLPLQDDEQEEQPQQDVPQVAEDVVEGAARGNPRCTALPSHTDLLSGQDRHSQSSPVLALVPGSPGEGDSRHNPHLRLPSGWAQRKL